MPYVECRLVVRRARGLWLEGGEGMTWGALDDASFDEERGELTLHATFGPSIRVERLDVAVSASDRVLYFKTLRSSPLGEVTSGRIDPADVTDPEPPT